MNRSATVVFTAAMVLTAAFAVLAVYDKTAGSSDGKTRIFGSQESMHTSEKSSMSDSGNSSDIDKTDIIYDTSAVSEAYLNGSSDGLGDLDRKIYDKAVQVIDEIIAEDMSDFEKELAVHDWIVYNCTYDKKALGILGGYNENSDNPYGVLYNGQAICKGYTTAFQMFMDMLEIPCLTISASDIEGDEHAWNMVKIENVWYYTDVTWDDPVPDYSGRLVTHSYFNVTEEYMKNSGHVWDTSNLEKADSVDYSYSEGTAVRINSSDELKKAASDCLDRKREELYVVFSEKIGAVINGTDGDYFDPSEDSELYKSYIGPLEQEIGGFEMYIKEIGGKAGLEIIFFQ